MATVKVPPPGLRLGALAVTWVSYWLLLASLLFTGVTTATPNILLVPTLLPLLLFLPGMVRRQPRSFAYLCFVALLYFTVIVTNLFKPGSPSSDVVALIAVVTLFVAAMLFSRWQKANATSSQEQPPESTHETK
ncbi:MAG: DUF2069 domain-containing protein [Porticoccaceae bacterium]